MYVKIKQVDKKIKNKPWLILLILVFHTFHNLKIKTEDFL